MSILITGMDMPTEGTVIAIYKLNGEFYASAHGTELCHLVPVPPHGDLIDRDALIKDGWLNLHKEVMRMGGYAVHELPLKNPSIPVIIPAEEGE